MGAAGGTCAAVPCCVCCEQTGERSADFVKVVTVSTYSEAGLDVSSTAETCCGDSGEDFRGGAFSFPLTVLAEPASRRKVEHAVAPDLAVDLMEESPYALWDSKELAFSPAPGVPGRSTTGGLRLGVPEEGQRLETYEDGSVYEGKHSRGLRHGRGVWRSSEESYEGQWADDHRHGDGRQTWRDGRVFVGQFVDGSFGGHGRMEWRAGSQGSELTVFDGQYVADLKHGHGRFQWPDGRIYDGEWRAGMRNGRAAFTNAQGVTRRGLWKDDTLIRWLGPDEV